METADLFTVWDGTRERELIRSQQIRIGPVDAPTPEPFRDHTPGRGGRVAGLVRSALQRGGWWTVDELTAATGGRKGTVASTVSDMVLRGLAEAEHPRHVVGGMSETRQRYRLKR
jgi:hypothetical protein